MPEDFDWNSAGRGTAFVSDLHAVIEAFTARQKDQLKAGLNHLDNLTTDAVILSAEQVCPVGRSSLCYAAPASVSKR